MKRSSFGRAAGAMVVLATVFTASCARGAQDESAGADVVAAPDADGDVYEVSLSYRVPGDGPAPNFSPKGTQVPLVLVAADVPLPAGVIRPAKSGVLQVGPTREAWVPVLAAADAEHPTDLTRLFFDLNRNGDFEDDGPAFEATPSQREKTGDWWSSFSDIELSIPYGDGGAEAEPYLVSAWIVRDGDAPPDVMRYSRRSWRSGTVSVNGVPTIVAVMDANNDGLYSPGDNWSVLAASIPGADEAVLSHTEARAAHRMMFVEDQDAGREWVLEFRSIALDGRSLSFAVVDRLTTKAMDRAADDMLAAERTRARTTVPFVWGHDFDGALAEAAAAGRKVFIDFETDWCGPCKTMDEWIWTDAEVAAALGAGYVGVKIDGDLAEALVERFEITGYPTMVVLDSNGVEEMRAVGYQSSEKMLALLSSK